MKVKANKKSKASIIVIFSTFLFLLFSCEKEDTGYGNYILKVSNYTATTVMCGVYLDDKYQGLFFAKANQSISSSYCNNLVAGANQDNVYILTYVNSGKHTIELRNYETQFVLYSGEFKMTKDACLEQPLFID